MWFTAAAAMAVAPCALPARVGTPLPTPPIVGAAPPPGGKLVRDSFGTPNALETPNFVVRWGDAAPVAPDDVAALARTLEQVWAVEIDALGYPRPLTTAWYKLNVYIGDTGDGAPASEGAAGYYWYDAEAYPMLMISAAAVADPPYAEAVSAHEFFHGVQAAFLSPYRFGEVDFWWWEATATWITSQVFPGNPHYASLLFGQAFVPEQAINGYHYGAGGVLEFHPYGAFVFVTWLTEVAADPHLVYRSWDEAPRSGDPMDAVVHLLDGAGWSLAAAWSDFTRRNAAWDYADGAIYAASIDASGGWASPDSRRPTTTVSGVTPDWVDVAEGPHTVGAHYHLLVDLPAPAHVAVVPPAGPTWSAHVAGRDATGHVAVEVPVDGTPATIDTRGWSEAWLVVAAVDGTTDAGPLGGYRFRVDPPPDTGVEPHTGDTAGPAADTGVPLPADTAPAETGLPAARPDTAETGSPLADTATPRASRPACGCGHAASSPPVVRLLAALARRRVD